MMKIRESTGRKNRKKKDLVNVRTDVLEKEKEEQLSHIPYVQKKKNLSRMYHPTSETEAYIHLSFL
jgi:3-dehydroquinate dehydratase